MHHARIKTTAAAVVSLMIAAAVWVMVSPDSPSSATVGERHVIKINPQKAPQPWSAEADLYDGKGNKVYHWQESHGAGKDHVRWEFTDGGDNGYIDLVIHPSPGEKEEFKKLSLGSNHCYRILVANKPGEKPYVAEDGTCDF